MDTRSRHRAAAFTMVEILVVLSIMAVLAAVLAPRLTDGLGVSNMAVVREQAKAVQGSMDAWLVASPTLSAARQQFAPHSTTFNGKATAVPTNATAFIGLIGPYLAADARDQIEVITAPDGNPGLTTAAMRRVSAYIVLTWDSDYRNTGPRANLVIP